MMHINAYKDLSDAYYDYIDFLNLAAWKTRIITTLFEFRTGFSVEELKQEPAVNNRQM